MVDNDPLITIRNMSSIFSSDSEAFASESLENIEDMFTLYHKQGNIITNHII